jgi:hypothetical protein
VASWIQCTTRDGLHIQLNLDQVAFIRPHRTENTFTGSEIIFASGNLSSILINEDPETLTMGRRVQERSGQV